MRRVLVPAIVLVLGALAVIQLGSYGLFGRAAAAGTVPRGVPRDVGVRVYDVLANVPFLTFARVVAATTAIQDRRFAYAQALIDGLPRGVDRNDVQGRLDDALGDHERAVARYVAAGDLVRVSDAVDTLDREGKGAAALVVQRRLVAELEALHDTDSLAHAYWRLAELQSEMGDHRASLVTYRRSLALEPLSETYLLGAANEAMGHGELPFARTLFERVVQLDPGSADGHIGVGRVALRSGDTAEARRQVAIVRRLAPAYFDLGRLEKEIESTPDRAR